MMANHEFTLTALSIDSASTGEGGNREMAITISFTTAGETWKLVLPSMLHDELRRLISQIQREISLERYAASLTESESFTTGLIA